jgi:hypothetical protein
MASTAWFMRLRIQRAAAGQLPRCALICAVLSGLKPGGRFIMAKRMAFQSLLHQ